MKKIRQFLSNTKRVLKTSVMMSLAIMGVLSDTYFAPKPKVYPITKTKYNPFNPKSVIEYGLQQRILQQYEKKGIVPKTPDTSKNIKVAPNPFVPLLPRNTNTTSESRPVRVGGNPAAVMQTNPINQNQNVSDEVRAKAMAILTDYVNQMRAAGYSDYDIEYSLKNNRTITIPDVLPEGFGQNTWATGMRDEFLQANKANTGAPTATPGGNGYTWKDLIPSTNEYLNYMPGNIANRNPSYEEYSGQERSPYYNTTGKFSQTKRQNLNNALQGYIENYEGQRIQPSQYAYEAGIVGLPQDIGQQFYQEFLGLAEQKAAELKAAEEGQSANLDAYNEYKDLVLKYPEAGIEPTDTLDVIAAKIAEYNRTQDLSGSQNKKAQVLNDILEGFQAGQGTVEDAYRYALQNGVILSYEDIEQLYFNYFKE